MSTKNKLHAKVVSELGEFGLIDCLTTCPNAHTRQKLPQGWIGVGDDCAVIPKSDTKDGSIGWYLVSVDTMVQNRHFKMEYSSGFDVGWKLVMSAVSDIAAMGGKPLYAVASLCVPSNCEVDWVKDVYCGMYVASDAVNIFIVGGDTVQGAQIVLSLTVFGETQFQPLCRSGALVGDRVWVSGEIGLATCGLSILAGEVDSGLCVDNGKRAIDAHRRPCAQTQLGLKLGKSGVVSSLIDISDGLLKDLGHIAKSSDVDICVFIDAVPVAPEITQVGMQIAKALTGGDDYQLLWTTKSSLELFERNKNASSNLVRCIGEVRKKSKDLPQIFINDGKTEYHVADYLKKEHINGNGGFCHF